MKRREFLRGTSLIASSALVLGSPKVLNAVQSNKYDGEPAELDDIDAKLDKPLTGIIIGAGNRGRVYAEYASRYPGSFRLIGVSDIDEFRRNKMADRFDVKPEKRFGDWSEVFKQPKMADIVFITMPDSLHYASCMKALEMGYHVVLEKPAAQSAQECLDILKQSRKYNCIVAVCHVLRYTPYFKAMKTAIDSGKIGDLISIQHLERVEIFHYSDSYVRGIWRNSDETTPIIMSKSCHDMDIIRWLVGKKCNEVSAFGNLNFYKSDCAPKGAAKRCLDCKLEPDCTFSAKRIYYDRRARLGHFNLSGDKQQQGEQILSYLKNTDYGKCVFHSDNNQPDHFVMNMRFDDNLTAQFAMECLSARGGRFTRIWGTKGELEGDMSTFTITNLHTRKKEVWSGESINSEGHGGGDLRLVRDMLWAVKKGDESYLTSNIEASIESHIMGFEAEKSRLSNGVVKKIQIY